MDGPRVIIEQPALFTSAGARAAIGLPVLTLVKGTSHGEWADPGSPFRTQVLEPAGIIVAARVEYWSGALWFPRDDWRKGGDDLADALASLPLRCRHILSHSHGMQVASFAAAQVQVACWTSVSGPVRSEMADVYAQAVANSQRVTQIAAAEFDKTQWGGQWFGLLGLKTRDFPGGPKVTNIRVPGVGHSALLYDAPQFHHWSDDLLAVRLTEAA